MLSNGLILKDGTFIELEYRGHAEYIREHLNDVVGAVVIYPHLGKLCASCDELFTKQQFEIMSQNKDQFLEWDFIEAKYEMNICNGTAGVQTYMDMWSLQQYKTR